MKMEENFSKFAIEPWNGPYIAGEKGEEIVLCN